MEIIFMHNFTAQNLPAPGNAAAPTQLTTQSIVTNGQKYTAANTPNKTLVIPAGQRFELHDKLVINGLTVKEDVVYGNIPKTPQTFIWA